MILNQRMRILLEELIYSEKIPLGLMAHRHGVSRQTIYEDIGNINFWLQKQMDGKITIKDGKMLLESADVKQLAHMIYAEGVAFDYFDKKARRCLILSYILRNPKTRIAEINAKIPVSKSTIVTDIKALKSFFTEEGLILDYKEKSYVFIGEEQKIRQTLINFFIPQIQYFSALIPVGKYLAFLQQTQSLKRISKMSLDILALALYIMEIRQIGGFFIADQEVEKMSICEEAIVKDIADFMGVHIFSIGEGRYVNELVHCFARFPTTALKESKIKKMSNQITQQLKLLNLPSHDISGLIYGHVQSMYYRVQLGLCLKNTTLTSIKTKYGFFYFCFQNILQQILPNTVPLEIINHEASYLGILMQTQVPEKALMRALIVCYQGISVSILLRQQIEQSGMPIEIIGQTSAELVETFPPTDIIISTTKLEINHPNIIYVQPILGELDYKKIMRALAVEQVQIQEQNKLYQIVRKHVSAKQLRAIMKDYQYHTEVGSLLTIRERREIMLDELLTEQFICYEAQVSSWEEAILKVAEPLQNHGYIESSYTEKIIENVKTQGEYIALRPGFALPHARPEDGVHKIGMSFLRLETPVFLNNNPQKPISIFVMLAAVDAQKHLMALSELVDFIAEDEAFEQMLATKNAKELRALIQK